MGATIFWSYLVPDAPLFQHPAFARIFFWHFPCPMMLLTMLIMGAYFSLRQFVSIDFRNLKSIRPETNSRIQEEWDLRACTALEIGFIFACLTMISGMLFSLVQWGALWQQDPRQTSFLLALLFYFAYFALRTAFRDPEKRAANSAAYMLAAVLPLVFLILVFPRLPWVEAKSFHPTQTIMQGELKGQYAYVTISVLILTTILTVWIYRLRTTLGLFELKQHYGKLETGSRVAAPAPVVRPVRVPSQDGPAG